MFLSGLNSIDFSGLVGLGAVTQVPPNDAVNIAWTALGAGQKFTTFEEFKTGILNAFKSGYKFIRSDEAVNGFIGDSVISNSIAPPEGWDIETAAKRIAIESTLASLRARGYYVVDSGFQISAPAPVQKTPIVTQPAVDTTGSIAYRGAIAAQQAGKTQTAAADPIQQIKQTVSSVFAPLLPTPRTGLPNIYRRVPFKQTPADRQRLIWIIGGFGIVFAIAIGVIAARE